MNSIESLINNFDTLPNETPNVFSGDSPLITTMKTPNKEIKIKEPIKKDYNTPSFFLSEKSPKYIYKKTPKIIKENFEVEEKFEDEVQPIKEKTKSPLRLSIIKPTEIKKTFQAFNNLSKEQEKILRLQYKSNMNKAFEHYKNILKLPKYDKNDSLSITHTKYEKIRFDIKEYQTINKYKTILSIVWPAIEFIVTNFLDIDIGGYADLQSKMSKFYESYLIDLTQKYIEEYGIEDSFSPFFMLCLFGLLHLGVFIGIQLFIPQKDVAKNIYKNLIKEITNHVSNNENTEFGEEFNIKNFLVDVAGPAFSNFFVNNGNNSDKKAEVRYDN